MKLILTASDGGDCIILENIEAKNVLDGLAKLHVRLNDIAIPKKYWRNEDRVTADKLLSDNEPPISC